MLIQFAFSLSSTPQTPSNPSHLSVRHQHFHLQQLEGTSSTLLEHRHYFTLLAYGQRSDRIYAVRLAYTHSELSILRASKAKQKEEYESEESSTDAPVALYPSQQEVRPNVYATANTPTTEYGVQPASARSGTFPEQVHRQYHPASNHGVSSGSMAQSTSPSMSLQDGRSDHHNSTMKSDQDVPIDPSIAASSPTYPHGQYSPYPQQDMSHGYPGHPQGAMYAQPRPDWAGYAGHPQQPSPMGYGVNGQSTPTHAPPGPPRHPVSLMIVVHIVLDFALFLSFYRVFADQRIAAKCSWRILAACLKDLTP
jgi:hypothetical protein